MFKKLYNRIKERCAFNALNCQKKQAYNSNVKLQRKIEEITGRIKYVVESSLDEHCVVYTIHSYDKELFPLIRDHFTNLGFQVTEFQVPSHPDEFYLISW